MKKVTGQPLKSRINADRKVIETTEELIALFKREFGENWQAIFRETVNVTLEPGQP